MAASKNVGKKRLGRGLNSLLSSTRLKDLTESESANPEEISEDSQEPVMGLPLIAEGADATDLGKGKSGRNVVAVVPGTGKVTKRDFGNMRSDDVGTGDLKTKSGTGVGSEGRSLIAGNGETISGDSGLGKVKKFKKVSGPARVKNAAGRGVEGAEARKIERGKEGLGEVGIRGSNQHSALSTPLKNRKQESGVKIKEGRKGLGIGDGDAVIEKVVGEKVVGGLKSSGTVMGEIAIELIARNPHQPRQHWDDEKLGALAESIKANGIIQPVLVRTLGDRYQLIAGERRLRGAALAGLAVVPAIVRDASEEQMMEWALVENIHRSDLNAMERARAYREYIRRFSLTQEEAAVHLGEDRSTIANYMRLLELPGAIQEMVVEGALSMGHARELLRLKREGAEVLMAQRAIRGSWTVRFLAEIVGAELAGPQPEAMVVKGPKEKSAHVLELEREFTRAVGTKVEIEPKGSKGHQGRVVIEYYSLDDFERIQELLGQ